MTSYAFHLQQDTVFSSRCTVIQRSHSLQQSETRASICMMSLSRYTATATSSAINSSVSCRVCSYGNRITTARARLSRPTRRAERGVRPGLSPVVWRCVYSFHSWGVTSVYPSVGGGGDPGSVDVFAQHSHCWLQTVSNSLNKHLQIFYHVVHQKESYTLTLLA